jgi:hypothetical protein
MASTPGVFKALDGPEHPIHKILNHLKSRKIDPRAGSFAEQAA